MISKADAEGRRVGSACLKPCFTLPRDADEAAVAVQRQCAAPDVVRPSAIRGAPSQRCAHRVLEASPALEPARVKDREAAGGCGLGWWW